MNRNVTKSLFKKYLNIAINKNKSQIYFYNIFKKSHQFEKWINYENITEHTEKENFIYNHLKQLFKTDNLKDIIMSYKNYSHYDRYKINKKELYIFMNLDFGKLLYKTVFNEPAKKDDITIKQALNMLNKIGLKMVFIRTNKDNIIKDTDYLRFDKTNIKENIKIMQVREFLKRDRREKQITYNFIIEYITTKKQKREHRE